MSNLKFTNFGKMILVRAYFSIFSMILGLIFIIRTILLMFVPIYSPFYRILSGISLAFAIIGLVITLLIVITANQLTLVDNHPFLKKFYSRLLVSFILATVGLVYPIIHTLIVRWIWYTTTFTEQLGFIIANIIGLMGIIPVISAWSFFSKYSTDRRYNPNIAQGSNLIRIGAILSIFSGIFAILDSIFIYFIIFGGIPYNILITIILWVILIGSMLLDIIIPILFIIGYFKVGKSIQSVTISSNIEPTL
ncbi:MAG: hypothetical protein EU530_00460, partial [Promethearchaeota archaeon]